MKDRLSKNEIRKDMVQESIEAVASTVGEVTNVIVNAVRDVSKSIGGLATDAFAIRDGARRARAQLEQEEDDELAVHRPPESGPDPE
jgi:hypothetical protein